MLDIERIAEMCHEANRLYCLMLGDDSQKAWPGAPHWQKQSAIAGVVRLRNDPMLSPAQVHSSWMEQKVSEGWKYGPVKDQDAKEHPCIVLYKDLPPEQRVKDRLFRGIALALLTGDDNGKKL